MDDDTDDNFVHALWLDGNNPREIMNNFVHGAKQKNLKCIVKNNIISANTQDKYHLPVVQLGVSSDNIILARVLHQDDVIRSWNRPRIDGLWDSIRRSIKKEQPDILIEGAHNCMINCPDCCDEPGYETKIKRKYWEYLIPVGNYCSYVLFGEEDRRPSECCEYWCPELREPYAVCAHDGLYGPRPTICGVQNYSKDEKLAFQNPLNMGSAGEAAKSFKRYHEVLLFKNSIKNIELIAEEHGICVGLIETKSDVERAKKTFC